MQVLRYACCKPRTRARRPPHLRTVSTYMIEPTYTYNFLIIDVIDLCSKEIRIFIYFSSFVYDQYLYSIVWSTSTYTYKAHLPSSSPAGWRPRKTALSHLHPLPSCNRKNDIISPSFTAIQIASKLDSIKFFAQKANSLTILKPHWKLNESRLKKMWVDWKLVSILNNNNEYK